MKSLIFIIGFVLFYTASAQQQTCSTFPLVTNTTCTGVSGCTKCAGQTDCCSIPSSAGFGICKTSAAQNCPDGSTFSCNGGNCPASIKCIKINPLCTDLTKCWGTISCTGTCPTGYKTGMFCHYNGASGNFKVCCGTLGASLLPVNCEVSAWSPWTTCNATTGKQQRTRTITKQPANGGNSCPALVETQDCDIDCVMSEWSAWTLCDKRTGLQNRTRTIVQQPVNNGTKCLNTIEYKQCPVDCEVSQWSLWGPCLANGTQIRTRVVTLSPINGGAPCPSPLIQTQSCVGCGAEIVSFPCALDKSKNFTVCNFPQNLSVSIINKPGFNNALVRVNAKPRMYYI
jgi:hypothetical protein